MEFDVRQCDAGDDSVQCRVAVIALPSGVITASYLDELREEKKKREK